jgi:pyruvate dehydrogenase E2 component (dihydrolipoamide acetyltransferase)
MAAEFKLPNLGEGVDEGEIVGVRFRDGEVFASGAVLFEVETHKAVMEVPAPEAGRIVSIRVATGDKIHPGQVLALVDTAPASSEGGSTPAKVPPTPAAEPAPKPEAAPSAPVSAPSVPQAPAATPAVPDKGDDLPAAASPSIRRLARELGVDLARVKGSGAKGRVVEADVKAYVKAALGASLAESVPAAGIPALPDFSRWGSVVRTPLKGVKKATAEGMSRSWSQIPRVTQFDLADITDTEAARKRFVEARKGQPGKVTVTVLALKAVARAIEAFPHFASSFDAERREVVQKSWRHLGVAVDSPGGLMVPVVRDPERKGLVELAQDLENLAEKVRTRKIALEDMQGSVFTISNLGAIGGTHFTPIVNWPEAAILGISRAREELKLDSGRVVPRLMLGLSLSYDHRLIDGADGARFLRRVCEALENPFELTA